MSNFFKSFESYSGCAFNFLLKHNSNFLILTVFYVVITLGDELGIVNEEDEKFKFFSFESLTSDNDISKIGMSMNMNESDDFLGDIKKNERGDSIDSGMNTSMRFRFSSNNFQDILMSKIGDNRENGTVDNHNTISVKKVNIKSTTNLDDLAMKRNNSSDFPDTTYNKQNVINFSDNLLSLIKSSKKDINNTTLLSMDKLSSNLNMDNMRNKNIIKCIKRAHALFIEVVFICIICYIITISMLLLYKKMENDDIQNNVDNTAQLKNYKWTYKCNLESHDIIYYIGHLIVLISIIIKGVRIYQYECIFRCTKYITYASFVMLAFGPTVNVIFFFFFYFNIYTYISISLKLYIYIYIYLDLNIFVNAEHNLI